MPPQFDDAAYNEGRKMFRKGVSLRSIIEPIIAAEMQRETTEGLPHAKPKTEAEYQANQKASSDRRKAKENGDFSRCIGFADAFLDHIRR